MSEIIQIALFDKMGRHPEWRKFQKDFRILTGMIVELMDPETFENARTRIPAVEVEVHGMCVGYAGIRETRPHPGPLRPDRTPEKWEACQHLLLLAVRHFSNLLATSHAPEEDKLPAKILATCQWVRERALKQEVRLNEAAEAAGLSAGYLSRLFHASTGLTFQEYVARFRLEHACRLLDRTDRSITEIAFEAGFQSISQFNRSFRKVYRCSPMAYRKDRVGKKKRTPAIRYPAM